MEKKYAENDHAEASSDIVDVTSQVFQKEMRAKASLSLFLHRVLSDSMRVSCASFNVAQAATALFVFLHEGVDEDFLSFDAATEVCALQLKKGADGTFAWQEVAAWPSLTKCSVFGSIPVLATSVGLVDFELKVKSKTALPHVWLTVARCVDSVFVLVHPHSKCPATIGFYRNLKFVSCESVGLANGAVAAIQSLQNRVREQELNIVEMDEKLLAFTAFDEDGDRDGAVEQLEEQVRSLQRQQDINGEPIPLLVVFF